MTVDAYETTEWDRLVSSLRNDPRSHVSSQESSARFLKSDYKRLLDHPDEFSILMSGSALRGGWREFYSGLQTLYNRSDVTAEDKWAVGAAFLTRFGLKNSAEVARMQDLVEMYVEITSYNRSIKEARLLRGLLGENFTNAQAASVAVAFKGLVAGQARMRWLWSWQVLESEVPLSSDEEALIQAAIDKAVTEKRRELKRILSIEQFQDLYERHGYDSAQDWKERLAARGG